MTQNDLEGKAVSVQAEVEYVESVSMVVRTAHFYTRSKPDWKDKVVGAKTHKGRLGLVLKRMRPHPEVEEIPRGAKQAEAEEIVKLLAVGGE